MKFTLLSSITLALAATVVSAAVEPEPTPAVLEARQASSPIDVSQILNNPSAALAQASSLLAIPEVSSAFRAQVTQSAFQSQISAAFVSQFGSQTAEVALKSYSAVLASLLGSSLPAATQTGSSSSVSSSGNSGATSGSSSGSGNGASTLFTVTAMGSAMVAGAAVVIAVL